jgi:uncharacterized protein YegL
MPIIRGDRKVLPVVYVLDALAFCDREKWSQIKRNIKQSIKCLSSAKCEPCVYILEYSSVPVWTIEELRYVNDIDLIWNHSKYNGESNLGLAFDALNQKMQNGQMFSDGVNYEKPLVIVLTGGKSNDDWKVQFNSLAENPWFQSAEVVGVYLFQTDEKIIETISAENPISIDSLESFVSSEAVFCLNSSENQKTNWEISLLDGIFAPLGGARFIMNFELERGEPSEKPKVAFKLQCDEESVLVANKLEENIRVEHCIHKGDSRGFLENENFASSLWLNGIGGKAKVKFIGSDRVLIENLGDTDLKTRFIVDEMFITLNDGDCIIGENGETLLAVRRITDSESTSE